MIDLVILKLFFEFLKIGAFSFGGGMATLPYVYEMAERTNWIKADAITNILSVSQVTPGPLACNIGTIVGMNAQGILGALTANIAFILPAACFAGICFKMIKKVQKNSKANEVIEVVRAAALSMLVVSSMTLFKSAFIVDKTFNIKALILAIVLYGMMRIKKTSSIKLMLISTIIAGVCML